MTPHEGPSHDRAHRAVGALVGAAVGDALGAPFEFRTAGAYSSRFPVPVLGGIGEMIGGGGCGWAPGEFTDDTQMAVLVAESLLAHAGFDGDDLCARFRAWARSPLKDIGVMTGSVLRRSGDCAQAAADHFAAHPHGAAGNGSLMRTIPAALFFAGQGPEATMTAARRISALTHGDPAAGEGCAVYHELVRRALAGDDPVAGLPEVLSLVPEPHRERYDRMLSPAWSPESSPLPNGTVWGALATAVWAVRHAGSFEEAVVAAVECGDDADTTAAITGGLAGAMWGAGRIPSRWSTYVHGTVLDRRYRLGDLQDLARRLVGARPVPLTPDEPALSPVEVQPRLWATNLSGAATTPTDHAVVSLCRTKGYFGDHPVRREVYLVDRGREHNPALREALDDTLATIDALLAEGRHVVVHCHGGRSRTGLVLRAWLMRAEGRSPDDALAELRRRWPHTSTANTAFTDVLTEPAD